MRPIIKWPGGKDRELVHILPVLPEGYVDYYEPFVGGGSVFAALPARHYYINDFSSELMSLYEAIASGDEKFFRYARSIDEAWANADSFFADNSRELIDIYLSYRDNRLSKDNFVVAIDSWCHVHHAQILNILSEHVNLLPELFFDEMCKSLKHKLMRMKDLEEKKTALSDEDICKNIRTAVKNAVYVYFRALYNGEGNPCEEFRVALFLFIRNYCYSSMFRYSSDGRFNVPYGGIAYNNKRLERKINEYLSVDTSQRMSQTTLSNRDFEDFFETYVPTPDDFVFLDPPYDSEFSTYDQNQFSRADHISLANYLIERCQARWMLVIKNTDFIAQLYNNPKLVVRSFDKSYQVSFMNRNDRAVKHLIITNY